MGERAAAKQMAVEDYARRLTARGKGLGAMLRPLSYVIPHWWVVALMVGGTVLYALCRQGKLFAIKPFVDKVMPLGEGFWSELGFLVTVLAALAVGEAVFRAIKDYSVKYVQYRANIDIQRKVFGRTLSQEMTFYSRWKLGDILQRMSEDITVTMGVLGLLLTDLVLEPFLILGAAAVAFAACWQLSLMAVGVLALIVFPLVALGRRIRRQATKRQNYQARLNESRVQMLTGFKTVKMFGREEHERARFGEQAVELFRKAMRVARSKVLSEGGVTLFTGLLLAGVVWLGMVAVYKKTWGLTPGGLIAFLAGCQAMFKPLKRLANAYNKVNEALAGSQRVFGYLDSMAQPQDRGGGPLDGLEPAVAFHDVCFGYGDEAVLSHISFEAKAGEVTALVGTSGAGKTTVLDMVARLYRPRSGHITVGGTNVEDTAFDSYIADVAIVPQEPFLFAVSLRENIAYGKLDATDAQIAEAAKVANIHEFIAGMPEGYDTVVGNRGQTLSGGQRQRVATARAVLKDARILLLDEATSALDAESERAFYDALENLMQTGTKTVLVVAHRLSTVVNADRILVLDGGSIIEQGTHAELMARGGAYRSLFEAQFEKRADTPEAPTPNGVSTTP